jgi:hypothetical protein
MPGSTDEASQDVQHECQFIFPVTIQPRSGNYFLAWMIDGKLPHPSEDSEAMLTFWRTMTGRAVFRTAVSSLRSPHMQK